MWLITWKYENNDEIFTEILNCTPFNVFTEYDGKIKILCTYKLSDQEVEDYIEHYCE